MTIAFIGKYYKTKKSAFKAFDKMGKNLQKHQSIVEFKNGYLIMGNDQIEAINSKYYERQ